MAAPAARGCDATGIESFSHSPQRGRACLLSFFDNRQYVRGVLICAGLDCSHRALTGLVELRAPEGDAARLSRRKSLSGPRRYQRALFLCESRKEVKHKRIDVCAQLG